MNLEDVIIHIWIEKKNLIRDGSERAKEFNSKANIIENKTLFNMNKKQ